LDGRCGGINRGSRRTRQSGGRRAGTGMMYTRAKVVPYRSYPPPNPFLEEFPAEIIPAGRDNRATVRFTQN